MSDASSLAEHAADWEIAQYTFIPHPYSIHDARRFIYNCFGGYRSGKRMAFGIEHKETKNVVGMISLMGINQKYLSAEVGYWLGKRFWGSGYARDALQLVTKFGFENLKLHRLHAHVMHPNLGSMKLLESVGYKPEGILRHQIRTRGKWMDAHWYGMLADDYHELKKNW